MKNKKRILINFVNSEQHPFAVWSERVKQLEKKFKCTILCSKSVQSIIIKRKLIPNVDFITIAELDPNDEKIKNKNRLGFMYIALKRNLIALKYLNKLHHFEASYSFSSVLDLIIINFILKLQRKDIKWITYLDNTVPFTDKGNKMVKLLAWIFFKLSLFMIIDCDLVFVISNDLFNFLAERGFPKSKLALTSNGIEYDSIQIAKPKKQFSSDLVYMGRINEAKGIFDLIRLISLFKSEGKNYKLSIVGAGDRNTESHLKKEINKLGLKSQIKIYGWIEGVKKYQIIKSSKIFISLSSNESFGVALLEGVSCGLPAVAYKLKSYLSIYKNNEVQFAQTNNLAEIKTLVENILSNKNFINTKGIELGKKYFLPTLAKQECRRVSDCLNQ